MRILCGLVFIGFGIFVALATWLQTLLSPAGVSEATAGALLVGMVIAGIVGCAVLPPLVARRGAERRLHARRRARQRSGLRGAGPVAMARRVGGG